MMVQQVMTPQPMCCHRHQSLNDALRVMWDHDCGFVPIVDDDRHVVGVLTDRDAAMAAYFQGKPLAELPVGIAMSTDVVTCRPSDSIHLAEALMREHQIRRIVVIDDELRLRGVVSLHDLSLKGAPRLGLAETLSAISAPRHASAAA